MLRASSPINDSSAIIILPIPSCAGATSTPSRNITLLDGQSEPQKEARVQEWPTEETEPDSLIVHCPEGKYTMVGSAYPRFQTLDDAEERRDEWKKACRFARLGEKPSIDNRCF